MRHHLRLTAGIFLLLGTAASPPHGKAQALEEQMTGQREMRRETWLNPATGEAVGLTFDGRQTTLERAGGRQVFAAPPFDEARAVAETRESLRTTYRWNAVRVASWRGNWVSGFPDLAAARREFLALGFPAKLWDDMDALLGFMGMTPQGPGQVASFFGSMEGDEQGTFTLRAGPPGQERVLHSTDPAWRDNLLLNPTPEVKATYEGLYLKEKVTVEPPPPETTFGEQRARLRQQGLTRITARHPDGSLWLPPVLEPHRPALEASQKLVVRLLADPHRSPQLWQSKVGGVPYRPKGAAWPMSTEAHPRPLVFLAQVNFAELNADGHLPDHPTSGLLEFFILNAEFMGAETTYADFGQGGTDDLSAPGGHYRVIYYPQVIQEAAQLEPGGVKPEYDRAEVERLKQQGFSRVGDLDQIWDRLPFDFAQGRPAFPLPAVALRGVPDREMVTGADGSKVRLLNLPTAYWEDEQASEVSGALYETAPGGHKLGGYPDFTQPDPRRNPQHWVLLFQLDSDPALNLMWGDRGTGNFFIRLEDLKKRDFSRVAYHWDCG